MGYKIEKQNFRVVIEPRNPFRISGISQSEREWGNDCELIIADVRRHVDGVDSVYMDFDSVKFCEHCGSTWTEPDDSPHNGGCCHKDCLVYDSVEEFKKL